MFGKEVGLGLFPSDSLEYHSYHSDEIADIKPLHGVEKYWNSLRLAVFWSFLGQFRLCFSHPSHSILMPLSTWEFFWV